MPKSQAGLVRTKASTNTASSRGIRFIDLLKEGPLLRTLLPMRCIWLTQLVLLALLLCGGCGQGKTSSGAPATNQPPVGRPQAKLPAVTLWLGAEELLAEVARTRAQTGTGMMFRTEMAENEAMLFVFDPPWRASFYMKNTVLPLSCAYIDSEGVILEIHDLKPLDENPVTASSDKVRYVLETRQGWFERHKIGVGTVVRTPHGSLTSSVFGRR
jgi:uncharacterized membrane protein (UPF0127 family)